MKKKKRIIAIVSICLVVITVASIILGIFVTNKNGATGKTGNARDEIYVKEIFDKKIDDIIADPEWKDDLVSTTDTYVMVDSNKFDFANQLDVGDGYSYLYFNEESREVEMLVHNYVSYTNDKDPATEIQGVVAKIEGNLVGLLGNPSQPFMLLNTSGEYKDYEGLSIDEMIAKLIEGNTAMYTMFESDGMIYDMNIMFSDNTIYTTVWVSECNHVHSEEVTE